MSSPAATEPANVSELIERLAQRVAQVQADDLSGLAQMHGWCEGLVKVGGEQSLLTEKAQGLARLLEKIILGEVQDATDAMSALTESVRGLAALSAGPEPGPAPASPEPAAQSVAQAADATAASQAAPSAAPSYQSVPLLINPKELEFIKSFVEEAGEHIEAIEGALLEVERTPDDLNRINDLFRPFHTIKGMAGFLNLTDIGCLTHEVETVLDQARKGQRAMTPGTIDLVFDVVDILKTQIAAVAGYLAEPNGQAVPQPPIADMIAYLRAVVAGDVQPESNTNPGSSTAGKKIGENLVEQGVVPREVVDFAAQLQQARPDAPRVGEILRDIGVASARQVSKALRPQAKSAEGTLAAAVEQSVRIETAKLDALVDMVGELVIAQTLVSGNGLIDRDARLSKDVGQVAKIVRNLQEVALSMRMIPIGPTFQKMARLVRDVSRKAGKEVELTISGEETELDKNVIQQISDPLVHMVRNAVDHGIEAPDQRTARGKSPVGRLHLSACHRGGNIVIEIRDDGKGLDPQKLIAKGIERGLVQPGDELTDPQAYALIFAPGFSLAEKITDISGRGVGMDVVKRNIDQLRGRLEIASQKGSGTTFSILLPLTLAIIDGMVVRVGNGRFIIPTIALQQALRPAAKQITTVQHRGEVIQVRGQLIPLIQMGELFGLTGRMDPCENMVVIANTDNNPVGIVVEELLGQQQVVIKTLGERFQGLQGVSGAAILGDGRVGLILEISGIATHHATRRPPTRGAKRPVRIENSTSEAKGNARREEALSCAS